MVSYSKLRGRIFGKKSKTLSSLIYEFHQKHSLKREISFLEANFIIQNIIKNLNLKHFDYLDEYDEIVGFLIEVKRNDVDIDELDFEKIKKEELKIILNAYNEFLKEKNLADIADIEKFVLENIDEKHEIDEFENEHIHFFDSMLQKKILEKIKGEVLKETLPDNNTEIKTLECFDEFDEVVKVFKLIRELIDNGENIENIKIFATDIDKYFKIFEALAYEYKIPVYSTKGLEVKRYSKGRVYAKQKAKHLQKKLQNLGINVNIKDIEKNILNERFLVKNGIEITETNQIYLYKNIKHLFLVGANIESFPPSRDKNIFYVKDYEKIFYKNSLYKSSLSILNRMQKIAKNITATHQKGNLSILINENPLNKTFEFNSKKEEVSKPYENVPYELKKCSVSQINTYTKCPKQYFFKYVLGLKAPQEEIEEMDIMLKGEIMHKAFEIAVREDISDIEVLIKKAYEDEKIKKKLTGSIYEELYKVELRKILKHFLEYIQDINIKNSKAEYKIFLDNNLEIIDEENHQQKDPENYFFKGVIDRLDVNEEIEIIDYKSSDSKKKSDFEIKEGKIKDIQLGLYSYWAKRKFDKLVNAKLVTFKKGFNQFVKMKECDKEKGYICYNQEYEKTLKNHIFDTVAKIKKGEFNYINEPDCEYCDYEKICKR
ncbi:RecB family exonuclease [Nautilia lithotrophica]